MLKVLTDSSVFIGQLLCNDEYYADIILTIVIFFCEMAIPIGGAIIRKECFWCAKEFSGVLRFCGIFKYGKNTFESQKDVREKKVINISCKMR